MSFQQEPITDLKTWFQYAPPKGGKKHWKCKRSAMELARYITDSLPDMPDAIKEALNLVGESENDTYTWQPEYVTPLEGKGEGRNHDLAIFGNNIFIGVEAKADEKFDKLVEEWMNNASQNKHRRIDDLCKMAFGTDYSPKEHNNLHYQLLSALGGTVKESQKTKKSKAMLLVLVFTSKVTRPEKIKQNDDDFNAFVGKVGLTEKSVGSGKIVYAGHKKLVGVDTWIVKAKIEIAPDCENCSWKDDCEEQKTE